MQTQYINEMLNIPELKIHQILSTDGFEITKNGVKMATEPFGSEMYFDWVCRREGDEWPDASK
ncbi:hypothetical protein FE784_23970 [Paenibacillus hemerocallicola]|uniref:Uncharacterized protein n=1 Tax=Paenibacillus hemerocallicola TaxID=1172614 RepID=A0A5C4T4Z9_9BACL|nr:DUF6547 family protein [Paenibacillus hemerocallicola]TNJ63780.1 hypothetical protein FE784_23970 [Paenibacillus hemerocallicola]